MFYFTHYNQKAITNISDNLSLTEELEGRIYKVQDTPLTYRQINNLSRDKILPESGRKVRSWRKFDIYELVFLFIVKELKNYGFSNKRLKKFSKDYFSDKNFQNVVKISIFTGDIILTFGEKGDVKIYNRDYYTAFSKYEKSLVVINLYEIVSKVKQINNEANIFKHIASSLTNNELTDKESALIGAIRDGKYKELKISTDSGVIRRVSKQEEFNRKIYSEKEVLNILRENKFAKFTIVQVNGKIVNIKSEDLLIF